jgi:hypothetical protein
MVFPLESVGSMYREPIDVDGMPSSEIGFQSGFDARALLARQMPPPAAPT